MHDRYAYYVTKVLPRYGLPQHVRDEVADLFAMASLTYDHLNYIRLVFLNYQMVTHELLMAAGRPDLARPLRLPHYRFYQQRLMWTDIVSLCPDLSRSRGDVTLVQTLARRWLCRRHTAALRIQRACHRWLWTPRTRDGRLGINARLMLRETAGLEEALTRAHGNK